MADSRDQPELETLSYKPEHAAIINGYGKKRSRVKQPAKPSSANMGFNSVVIKPETRVNSSEVAGQHPELCNCIDCMPKSIEKQFEQPNKDLMIIEEIEGLMSQVNEKVFELQKMIYKGDSANKRYELISQALEEIDLFQKTTLFELRKAFE